MIPILHVGFANHWAKFSTMLMVSTTGTELAKSSNFNQTAKIKFLLASDMVLTLYSGLRS